MPERSWVAIVITTYNQPHYLELCLRSLVNQTYQNFEVFIADDGSSDETRDLILKLKREVPFMIHHFWHPDQGYQKSKINNKVFSQIPEERYPVIVCIDHDVVLHYRFVEDHYKIHEAYHFKPLLFMGRRVDLDLKTSQLLNTKNICQFNLGLNLLLIKGAWSGQIKNVLRSVRLNAPKWLEKLLKRDCVYDLLGSNFSISTKLLKQVNGYNEDYQAYWGEDGDLFVRVRNAKAILIGKIGYAVQWHLFHKRLEESQEHRAIYQDLLGNATYTRCKNGIDKL